MHLKNLIYACLALAITTSLAPAPKRPPLTPKQIAIQKTQLAKPPKIVAWLQVRNEEAVIEQSLRMLALYADAIVVLDDASDDNTVNIIQTLTKELPIAELIVNKKSAWQTTSEKVNRQKLLLAARAAGATHIIMLDADEIFTAPCAQKNWLRNKILALKPGQILRMPTIHPWDNLDCYRNDAQCDPFMDTWYKVYAFADDGLCSYDDNHAACGSVAIHAGRSPKNIIRSWQKQTVHVQDLNYAVLHFQCINLINTDIKKSWYMCLELIRRDEVNGMELHEQHIQDVNEKYSVNHYNGMVSNTPNIHCKKLPHAWYDYDFFDGSRYAQFNQKKMDTITAWFKQYGQDYFKGLALSIECPSPTSTNYLKETE